MVASLAKRRHRPGCMHWRRREEEGGRGGASGEEGGGVWKRTEVKGVGEWDGEEA